MTRYVQALVDALAAELGAPVGLDDPRLAALAYSPHHEEVDEARRATILRRATPEDVAEWVRGQGIGAAEGPVRIPGSRDLRTVPRICVPVRFQGALLGYLWLLDPPSRRLDDGLDAAVTCAHRLGELLFRAWSAARDERAREAAAVRAVLVGDGAAAASAWRALRIPPARSYTWLVAEASCDDPRCDGAGGAIAAGLDAVRPGAARRLLAAQDGPRAAVLVAHDDAREPARRATALHVAVRAALPACAGCRAVVGVGRPRSATADLRAAHREAAQAARVAAVVDGLGDVAHWDALGAYRTIGRLLAGAVPQAPAHPPVGPAATAIIPESLARLLADADAPTLVPTLETYLELGADAQAAAARVLVHRSSLYNRLRRIEHVAGVDLRSGEDRLELHLGLRIWRMTGGGAALRAEPDPIGGAARSGGAAQ